MEKEEEQGREVRIRERRHLWRRTGREIGEGGARNFRRRLFLRSRRCWRRPWEGDLRTLLDRDQDQDLLRQQLLRWGLSMKQQEKVGAEGDKSSLLARQSGETDARRTRGFPLPKSPRSSLLLSIPPTPLSTNPITATLPPSPIQFRPLTPSPTTTPPPTHTRTPTLHPLSATDLPSPTPPHLIIKLSLPLLLFLPNTECKPLPSPRRSWRRCSDRCGRSWGT